MMYPETALCAARRGAVGMVAGIAVSFVCLTTAVAAVSTVDDQQRAATRFAEAGVLTSPGIQMGITSWDQQHLYSQGHQVAKNPGANTVHFCWTMWDQVPSTPDYIRFVNYSSWDVPTGTWNQGDDGVCVSLGDFAYGGYSRIDIDRDNLAHLTLSQAIEQVSPLNTWHLLFPIEGSLLHLDEELAYVNTGCWGMIWPDIAVGNSLSASDADVYHIISSGQHGSNEYCIWRNKIAYWRYDAGAPLPAWEGPVLIDTFGVLGYVIDADDDSGKVAIAYHPGWGDRVCDVGYKESRTAGAGWINGTELGPGSRNVIAVYEDTLGPEAYGHLSVAYDHVGGLHIVWDERRTADSGPDVAIKHWSNIRGTVETVTLGYYPNTGTYRYDLNLSKITLGIGDGSTLCNGGAETNEDYLYVVYSKLGGETPEEQADISALGYANSELYLTVSNDGGTQWSTPVNLTNTKTPGCSPSDPEIPGPGDCASEHWATIARTVDDINIFYVLDREAGPFTYSPWTINPVMYLNIPGGTVDAPYLCPPCACPCHGDPVCDGVANVLDVVTCIDVAFRDRPPQSDPGCPPARSDVNCDGVINVLDVVRIVNVAFRGGDPEAEFCDPCAP